MLATAYSRRVETLPDDSIAWVWAYSEQLKLLDVGDAFWISTAKNSWTARNLKQFAHDYRVARGTLGRFILNNPERIIEDLHGLFLGCGDSMDDINAAWLKGIESLRDSSGGFRAPSFCSKLLWCYKPASMFMYDQFSRKSVSDLIGKGRIELREYIPSAEKLFKDYSREIGAAATYFCRTYPYHRRIFDKWLWLEGSGRRRTILERFRLSLEIAQWRI
jgi:hypothetical protein